MNELKEFHVNKENFDSVIQNLPFSKDTKIIFDDKASSLRFSELLDTVECADGMCSLIISETYMKCYHNGYFCTFKDCTINSQIEILNPNFGLVMHRTVSTSYRGSKPFLAVFISSTKKSPS